MDIADLIYDHRMVIQKRESLLSAIVIYDAYSGQQTILLHSTQLRFMLQFKDVEEFQPGQQLKVEDVFKVGDYVDVAGKTIGKGFQGGLLLCPQLQSCSNTPEAHYQYTSGISAFEEYRSNCVSILSRVLRVWTLCGWFVVVSILSCNNYHLQPVASKTDCVLASALRMCTVNCKSRARFKNVTGQIAGAIRRWGHHRGPMAHGSKSHRLRGSIGASASPARVFPGIQMAGHMGNERKKIRMLKVRYRQFRSCCHDLISASHCSKWWALHSQCKTSSYGRCADTGISIGSSVEFRCMDIETVYEL